MALVWRRKGLAMYSLSDLVALVKSSGVFNFEETFKRLHHFSKAFFATRPAGFSIFIRYCSEHPNGVRVGGENIQTIQRCCHYLIMLKSGCGESAALATAWQKFPTV